MGLVLIIHDIIGDSVFSNLIKKIIKPFLLVSLLGTYLMGLGLVQYVRTISSWPSAIQGMFFLLLITLGVEAMSLLGDRQSQDQTSQQISEKQRRQERIFAAVLAATFLTVATSILVGWMVRGAFSQGWIIIILAALVGLGFYYFCLVNLLMAPFRILAEIVVFVIIPPAAAFFIQSGDFHWLLTLAAIPFVAAYMAYPLLQSLQEFGVDWQHERKTIANEIGWEKTMTFHNALILLTYLLFALIALLGFPWFLIWPVFLTLPIGILEIWLMERVRRGQKPLWRVMQVSTASIYLIPMYLVSFAFWIR